jgi:hypothetical protein
MGADSPLPRQWLTVTFRLQSPEKSECCRLVNLHEQTLISRLYVTFVDKEGDEHKIAVSKGDNLLDIAQANDIEMEGQQIQR